VWIRAGNDQAYAQVLAFSLYQWTQDRDTVLLAIKGEGFSDLNAWKQHGFYVSVDGNAFMTPREAVDPNLAEAVHQFLANDNYAGFCAHGWQPRTVHRDRALHTIQTC